ncbi:MAG TPA: mechanosensitive ion channel family protein [Pseudonocardia sp.]|jgi:moderate conductance mechanosensitive channel|nr:mechanosensitive ion channel family protein [Pseudonocardia sp.]
MTLVIPEDVIPDDLAQPACVAEPGSWCARFYQWTNNDFLARSADTIVDKTVTVAVILVFAVLARLLLHRAISRIVEGAATGGPVALLMRRAPGLNKADQAPMASRRLQRARTIGSVLRSSASAVVLVVASVMILAEFGVALGPILASAGIVGVALGFGAQNLVRDFLSGMFMLLEDQYGVGDVVDLGEAVGEVEAVGLRITTLRDLDGTVWYVRNGEILRVGNKSQLFAVAVVDLPLAHTADMEEAAELVGSTAAARVGRPDLADDVLEPPVVLGVEQVRPEGVVLRMTVKVKPGRQWAVQRALNASITDALDDAGVPRPTVFPSATGPAAP